MTRRPAVLFACVHNSGRSVAAAALARRLAAGRIEIRDAGSDPRPAVDPTVAAVLAERGLPVAEHVPTTLDRGHVEAADLVVTMGCGERCPYVPGKRYQDWPVDDPAGRDVDAVRRIVDDLEERVRALVAEVLAAAG